MWTCLRNAFILFIILTTRLSSNAEKQKNLDVPFATKQLQVLKLYNNIHCLRKEDKDFASLTKKYNPLNHLDQYNKPEAVRSFVENLNSANYPPRNESYKLLQVLECIEFFDILWSIEDWNLFYKTAAYVASRMNEQMFLSAMNSYLGTRLRHIKLPMSIEIAPQSYIYKLIILKANGINRPTVVDRKDPENALLYWRYDPTLSQYHFNWHKLWQPWWDDKKYGITKDRPGELFLYAHHNLVARYKAERLSNKMKDTASMVFEKPMPDGDIPNTLTMNLMEFIPRKPNSTLMDTTEISIRDLARDAVKLKDAVSKGFFINNKGEAVSLKFDNGSESLGLTIFAFKNSVNMNYYGKVHGDAHGVVSRMADPTTLLGLPEGGQAYSELAVQDPIFFRIHYLVDDYYQLQQNNLVPYNKKDLNFPEVDIHWVRIVSKNNDVEAGTPLLTTYFESYTYDLSNSIMSCDEVNSGKEFKGEIRRLTHDPFEYQITSFSHNSGETRGIVRIYMSPTIGFDGKPFSRKDLFWNMFEMDRFPVTLKRGQNVIRRSSLVSALTIPDRPGVKEIIAEVNNAISTHGKLSPFHQNVTNLCGWPNHLLLPRGTKKGMKFKMFVIITSTESGDYDEDQFPQFPLCGNPPGKFPDGAHMGYPFNRKISDDTLFPFGIHNNYIFKDLIIQHKGKK